MQRHVVHTDRVPAAKVPLSQAIKVGDWVFASGQLGMDPRTGRLTRAERATLDAVVARVLELAGHAVSLSRGTPRDSRRFPRCRRPNVG